MNRRSIAVAILALSFASVALASWYDDYDAGIAAVRKGQWKTVVQRMSNAIAANPREGDKTRTYGAIFINYHPYYYRAVANLNLGNYEQAVSDFEKTSGPGEEDLGSIETLMARAKAKQQAAVTPAVPQPQPPTPQPQPRNVPPPVQPSGPSLDSGLRQQVRSAIGNAKSRMVAAQERKATGASQYAQATQALADANTRSLTAKSNDDLNAALASAQNAALLFDAAAAPGAPPPPVVQPPTRPAAATALAMGATTRRVRHGLELYFRGDFEEATKTFEVLTRDLPRNGWIWAFLGASQYAQYAFEADEAYKVAAMESFRQARRFGKFRDGLPQKYFSKRIRKAFDSAAVQ